MSDKDKPTGEIIEGHEYDGIKELDHPLPRWWVYLFYMTIVYGACYYAYYEFLGGPSQMEQYNQAMSKIESKIEATPGPETVLEVNVEELINDKESMAVGSKVFGQFCSACHGQKGEGVIGPNLTDKYWMHSKGDFKGVMVAMLEGFPDKGMPPWKDVVPREKHAPLAAYVLSLKGTTPANPKDPQGELIE